MTGTAQFTKHSDFLFFYREEVQWDNNPPAFREYFYEWKESHLTLYFPENNSKGKLFLTLDKDFKGTHPCRDDLYHAQFSFDLPQSFKTHFTVTGPKKDLVIETCLRPFNSEVHQGGRKKVK